MNENLILDTTDLQICEITKIVAYFFNSSLIQNPIKNDVAVPFRVFLDDGKDFEFVSATFFYQFFCDQASDVEDKVRGPNAFVERLPLWKIVERASRYFFDTVAFFQTPTCSYEQMFFHILHLVHFFKMDEEVFLTSIVIFNRYVTATRSFLNISLSNLFYLLILCILLAFKCMFDVPVDIRSVAQALNLNLSTITNNEVQILNALKYDMFYRYSDLKGLEKVFPLEGLMYLSFASRETLICPKDLENLLTQEKQKLHSSSSSSIYSFHRVLSSSRTISPHPPLGNFTNSLSRTTSPPFNNNPVNANSSNDRNSRPSRSTSNPCPLPSSTTAAGGAGGFSHSTSPNTSPQANTNANSTSSNRETARSLPPPTTPTTTSNPSPSSSISSPPNSVSPPSSRSVSFGKTSLPSAGVGPAAGAEGLTLTYRHSGSNDRSNNNGQSVDHGSQMCVEKEREVMIRTEQQNEVGMEKEMGRSYGNEIEKRNTLNEQQQNSGREKACVQIPSVIKMYLDFRLWLVNKAISNGSGGSTSNGNNNDNNPVCVHEYFDEVIKAKQELEQVEAEAEAGAEAGTGTETETETEMGMKRLVVGGVSGISHSYGSGNGGYEHGRSEQCDGRWTGCDGGGGGYGVMTGVGARGGTDGAVVGGVVADSGMDMDSSGSNPQSPITPPTASRGGCSSSSSSPRFSPSLSLSPSP